MDLKQKYTILKNDKENAKGGVIKRKGLISLKPS